MLKNQLELDQDALKKTDSRQAEIRTHQTVIGSAVS
jgi:hypothetical protein